LDRGDNEKELLWRRVGGSGTPPGKNATPPQQSWKGEGGPGHGRPTAHPNTAAPTRLGLWGPGRWDTWGRMENFNRK